MTRQRIDHSPDLPHGLGRHVNHDPRSRDYAAEPLAVVRPESVHWDRRVPIFDQGNLGSCTGNAAAGWLATDNRWRIGMNEFMARDGTRSPLDEQDAISIYSWATRLDPWEGDYPPEDTGSDGLSVTKVLRRFGYVDRYRHVFKFFQLVNALQNGPVLVGTVWRDGMFHPDSDGFVTESGPVVGGHEYLAVGVVVVDGYDKGYVEFANSWGSSWGDFGYFRMQYATVQSLLAQQGDATIPHPKLVG